MSSLEFVKRLNKSIRTKQIQRILDRSPLVLYYTVTGMTAEGYAKLKRVLHRHGLECHWMGRNKCLPVHEDDLQLLQQFQKVGETNKAI